jgi:hypothetical protein
MPTGSPDWTTLYYDSLRHLLSNPDWIEKYPTELWRHVDPDLLKKYPMRRIEKRIERLKRLESSLHHTLNVFFALAPASFVASLLDIEIGDPAQLRVVDCSPECKEWIVTRSDGRPLNLMNHTQPDLFIESPGLDIAIELKKAGGTSSLDQVLKYLAVLLLRRRGEPAAPRRRLLFVGPHADFAAFWSRRAYPTPDDVKQALQSHTNERVAEVLGKCGSSMDEVRAIADLVEIGFKTLGDLLFKVEEEIEEFRAEAGPSAEVYRKLLKGFHAELKRWQSGD